ncbi:MAG: hypothetical protein WAN03_12225 [Candidatus Sulfotelmatobacter sp.]
MSEVVQETQQEFWQPPSPTVAEVPVLAALPTMAEACLRCGSEFLLGSHFCHRCGRGRPESISATARHDAADIARLWEGAVARIYSATTYLFSRETWSNIEWPGWLSYLHFHAIQRWVGLSTGSLIAFVIGLGCVAGALVEGLVNPKTFVDWQAIQFYRAEWLLAATAAFVAGILLKKSSHRDSE